MNTNQNTSVVTEKQIIRVGESHMTQFGNPSDSHGYRTVEAKVEAIQENGNNILISTDNGTYWGFAVAVGQLQSYPSGVVLSCTHACREANMTRHYGSFEGFCEYGGFANFAR